MQFPTTLKHLAIIMGCTAILGADTARAKTLDEIEIAPIVRLAGSEISECGVAFRGTYKDAPYAVEFVLKKFKTEPQFVLAAHYAGSAEIFNMSIDTEAGSTAALLPIPGPRSDGWLEARGPIPGFTGSKLVQTMMVSGGRLILGFSGKAGGLIDVKLPAPFSHEVRGSYLNCAGDLVRPDN